MGWIGKILFSAIRCIVNNQELAGKRADKDKE